jgi:hypothetical protein
MGPSDFCLFRHLKKHLAGSRYWYEANCHLLAYDTWHQFLLYLDTGLGATVAQLLKCQLWLHEGLMHTISFSCRVHLKPDGTRWRTGGEVKGKLANGVGSQYAHTASEHGVSGVTNADAHTSAASSRLNWRPRRFKWICLFRQKTKSGFCVCAVTFQMHYTMWTSKSKQNSQHQSVGHCIFWNLFFM